MIKAASILYALLTTVIIAVFCYGLLLVFNLNNKLEVQFDNNSKLININRSALTIAMQELIGSQELEDDYYSKYTNRHTISSNFKDWGVFSICIISTSFNGDSINTAYLLAKKQNKKLPALYLRDNSEELKIAGNTTIEGDIYISERGVKKVNFQGNNTISNPKHTGRVYKSEKLLPQVEELRLAYPEDFEFFYAEELEEHTIINTFQSKTKIIEFSSVLEDVTLKGNIIIKSEDTLFVKRSAVLQDVIIDAPKIIFESGFVGNIQAYATSGIVLEENVILEYPSVLIVSSKLNNEKNLICKKGSIVKGCLILNGNGLLTEGNNKMVINENTTVYGSVYCDGVLSLYGTVKGHVVTSALLHKTKTAEYTSLILDGNILSNDVPENVFQIPTGNFTDNQYDIVLKQL